jgi:hypothetical protein
MFGSFLPSLLVGLHHQSLLGRGSRHCYGINYLDFVLLAPQFAQSSIQGATGGKSALADSGFTFAGLRSRSNSLYIDGVENNDEFSGSARTELSPETVQEFQVVNNGLSAESGGGASGPSTSLRRAA